jgi:nucleoid-associated protein YgaU
MPLQKAVIEIVDKRAIDPGRGLPARITVQFNPTEYTLSKGAQIAEISIPGIDSPLLQFIHGQNEKLTLDLFFDTTPQGMDEGAQDVRDQTRAIYQLVKMQPQTHAPPVIRFSWGSLSFKAIVESVQQKFTLFSPQGMPLRATLSVSFREYKTLEDQLRELNLQSPDYTKHRMVRQGDTLSRIAAEEYGDPGQWRVIALHQPNRRKIGNPRRLVPGTELEIPALGSGPLLFEE